MTLTIEQHRWLTEEFLGMCYGHPIPPENQKCLRCKLPIYSARHHKRPDFTDWPAFGLLWEKMQEHEDWKEFLVKSKLFYSERSSDESVDCKFQFGLINPTRFALAVCDFFNGGNDGQ